MDAVRRSCEKDQRILSMPYCAYEWLRKVAMGRKLTSLQTAVF